MTPWTAALQASLSITNTQSSLKLMCIGSVMPSTISFSVVPFSSHLQSFPASVSFQMSHIRWPKYWSFRFNISPSNEHSGLISFRMDWFDLLTVQGTLKSLCQHHSSKASILRCSRKMNLGSSLSVPYLFAFSCCLWGSQGKNTEVVCHSLLQWTTFCQNSLS